MICYSLPRKGRRARIVAGLEESTRFFEAMGARAASNKCFSFGDDAITRKLLSEDVCDNGVGSIPCRSSFRDLGVHLKFTRNLNGSTSTERITKLI